MRKLIVVVLAFMFISGCAQRMGDFTVASTKNMDIKRTLHRVDENERVVGRDRIHIILWIPIGQPNIKEAMDNAIEQKNGAVGLSDVTFKTGGWWIPFIYGQSYYEIEGNPVYEAE